MKIQTRRDSWKEHWTSFTVLWKKTGLIHDEGPDKDGGYGPYVQSERNASGVYLKYAKQLVEQGDAYYCFCDKARLDSLKTSVSEDGTDIVVYDKHCLGLSKEEVEPIWQQENLG